MIDLIIPFITLSFMLDILNPYLITSSIHNDFVMGVV